MSSVIATWFEQERAAGADERAAVATVARRLGESEGEAKRLVGYYAGLRFSTPGQGQRRTNRAPRQVPPPLTPEQRSARQSLKAAYRQYRANGRTRTEAEMLLRAHAGVRRQDATRTAHEAEMEEALQT